MQKFKGKNEALTFSWVTFALDKCKPASKTLLSAVQDHPSPINQKTLALTEIYLGAPASEAPQKTTRPTRSMLSCVKQSELLDSGGLGKRPLAMKTINGAVG